MPRLVLAMPCLDAVAAVAVLALAAGAASQAPAPAPSADCGSILTGLKWCYAYVQKGNTQGKPPTECCAAVKSDLKNPAIVACICAEYGQIQGGLINITRVDALPSECGADPAALSKCSTPVPSSGLAPKLAATRLPISVIAVLAAVAAPFLSYYYL